MISFVSPLLFLLLSFINGKCDARITVIDDIVRKNQKKKFPSTQTTYKDHIGKSLWNGFEYVARLQYIPDNIQLCPSAVKKQRQPKERIESVANLRSSSFLSSLPIIEPRDNIPIALMIHDDGNCTVREKLFYIMDQMMYAGHGLKIRYVLLGGSKGRNVLHSTEGKMPNTNSSTIDCHTDPEQPECYGNMRKKELNWNVMEEDIPLYLVRISSRTMSELIAILAHQGEESRLAGGTRITIDTRSGISSDTFVIWIAIIAIIITISCIYTLFIKDGGANRSVPSHIQLESPRPSGPRRLTLEQVQALVPVYAYDGSPIVLKSTSADDEERLIHGMRRIMDDDIACSSELRIGRSIDLSTSDCSICLDEYCGGDKIRFLNCHHAFHSCCIERWLVERSATCPLCLYEVQEEEEEDDVPIDDEEALMLNDTNGIGNNGVDVSNYAIWWNRISNVIRTSDVRQHSNENNNNDSTPIGFGGDDANTLSGTTNSDPSSRSRRAARGSILGSLFSSFRHPRRRRYGRTSDAQPEGIETITSPSMLAQPLLSPSSPSEQQEQQS